VANIDQSDVTGVENHSIDPIPLNERHGQAWQLGPLWFTEVAMLGSFAIGLIGPLIGASLTTSILGLVAGILFGTFFMATHAAQGPTLGLPQMIQSRAQFGFLGAIVPMAAAIFVIMGYFIFDSVLVGQAMVEYTGLSAEAAIALAVVLSLLLAAVGYNLIHRTARWLGAAFLLVFGILTIVALFTVDVPSGSVGGFQIEPFLTLFGIAAGFQLSWAPFVSDYTRYLPPDTSFRATFWWTYLGSAVGCAWMMVLGAFMATAYPELNSVQLVALAGDNVFDGYGKFAVLFAQLGLIATCAISLYTASLTLMALIDALKPISHGAKTRIVVTAVLAVVGFFVAISASDNFIINYTNFVLVLLYLLIPWTAINLVDYYLVRHGRYAIAELYKRDGLYDNWGKNGLIAYFVGFIVMIPFFSVPGFFVGTIANGLGGGDISVFVGLPVAAVLYYFLAKNSLDLAAEQRLEDTSRSV
jgi:NCS1 family nucleobase:cation symporter-1